MIEPVAVPTTLPAHGFSLPRQFSSTRSSHDNLQEAIISLNQHRSGKCDLHSFFRGSRLYFQVLTTQFAGQDAFRLWTRYFDVSYKVFMALTQTLDRAAFKSEMDKFIETFMVKILGGLFF